MPPSLAAASLRTARSLELLADHSTSSLSSLLSPNPELCAPSSPVSHSYSKDCSAEVDGRMLSELGPRGSFPSSTLPYDSLPPSPTGYLRAALSTLSTVDE